MSVPATQLVACEHGVRVEDLPTPAAMAMVAARMKQLVLKGTAGHGGKREGAGRKPAAGTRRRVAHRARRSHAKSNPVHVTLRAKKGLPSFRSELVRAMFASMLKEERSMRVVQWSLQRDHVHALVEAVDKNALSSGMRSLAIRFAKRLVAAMKKKKGKVWEDRYHAHPLRSPREVRNALVYVLQNAKKHGEASREASFVDPFSSAPDFDGWRDRPPPGEPAVVPRTWLLRVGWKGSLGLLATTASPRM